jgi:dienelactone hydrolase
VANFLYRYFDITVHRDMVSTIVCAIFLPLSVHAKGYLTETKPLPQLPYNRSTCCPHGGLGKLDSGDYKPKGVTETVEGLPIYRVGQGEKCLIWNYDIFGLNSGRTKQTADLFAEQGYMVLVPDYYRGEMRDPAVDKDFMAFMKGKSEWSQLEQDWVKRIRPHALRHGAKRFGSLGTCWGTYVTLKLCGRGEIEVGVNWHPSHVVVSKLLGEDVKTLLENSRKCKHQLMMAARDDAPEDKVGGLASQILKDKLEIVEFKDMVHGWAVRGNLTDPLVKRDVHKALQESIAFLKKHF